ncbi:MAG: MbnP family protein [Chitinophagales bacterium]
MKKLSICLLLLVTGISTFTSCKKEGSLTGTLQTTVSYNVDGLPLLYDSLIYHNDAGNLYGINKLNYYLSGFHFKKASGSVYSSPEVFYLEAFNPGTNQFTFKDVPSGDYTEISFYLGLDSVHNLTDALPATLENINMAWPDMMGGGYHFMKFEGHAQDSAGTYGFAMHLGKNANLVSITLNRAFSITEDQPATLPLHMNINEWFRGPSIYNFETDGNYSMSNDAAMLKLKNNGSDIFND